MTLLTENFLEVLTEACHKCWPIYAVNTPLTNGKYRSFDERIQLIIQDLIEGYHISINHALVSEELLDKSFLKVSI
jgi:hypothetical protein